MRPYLFTASVLVIVAALAGCQGPSSTPPSAPAPVANRTMLTEKITLVADQAWSAEECDRLRQLASNIYPSLVQLYGEPSEAGTITILRQTGSESTNQMNISVEDDGQVVVAPVKVMSLSTDVFDYPSIMVHELAHRFHGRFVVQCSKPPKPNANGVVIYFHDAVEEGMAQAAADLVAKQKGFPPDKTHVLQVDAGFNKSAFQFHQELEGGSLYPIRLNLAAWAFTRWEENHPGFLLKLNHELYRLPPPLNYGDCWKSAEKVTPGASRWFNSQYIFNSQVKTGEFLFLVGERRSSPVASIDVLFRERSRSPMRWSSVR